LQTYFVISGFRRGINLIFSLLERHATYVGNFRRFRTTYRSHLQRNLAYRLSRNVSNYKSVLCNIPEDRRSRIIIVVNEGDTFFSPGASPLEGCKIQPPKLVVFYTPLADFSLLAYEVSWSHTTTRRGRWDSSERMIRSSQRPLPDNTQHSQQTSKPWVGFETTIAAGERP